MRRRSPLDVLEQIGSDALPHDLEWQLAAVDPPRQSNEMDAIARLHRSRYFSGGEIDERGFELRCRVARPDLAQAATKGC